MRKKIYFIFCMAACLMFAASCNKNKPSELTTSAYNDTVSDMEKTTEASDDSLDDSTKEEASSTESASSETTQTTKKEETSSNSTKNTASSTTSASNKTDNDSKSDAAEEELITAEGDENFEEPTTATKESEKESWASSGTLSGFVDGDSVEIIMSDGTPKTFFVYDEKIASQLEKLLSNSDETTINFISRPIAGQSNSQIIEIK